MHCCANCGKEARPSDLCRVDLRATPPQYSEEAVLTFVSLWLCPAGCVNTALNDATAALKRYEKYEIFETIRPVRRGNP